MLQWRSGGREMDITFTVPARMTPAEVADTFAAYLLGFQTFRNQDRAHGPFQERQGDHSSWQLDGTNSPAAEGDHGMLRCRYDRGAQSSKR